VWFFYVDQRRPVRPQEGGGKTDWRWNRMVERRKRTRSTINYPVYFIGSDKDGNITAQDIATGLNIHENGMLIESDSFINARSIEIMVKSKDKTTIKINGAIIYSTPSDEGKFRTGICFKETPESTLLFIDEMIQAASLADA
jgi:hypothetical protein